MSPRRADPRTPSALVHAAARVLASEGPSALTTRRLAREAGCSTMAVYTNFDGMTGLVRAMVHEGFARLYARFSRVRATADPVADLALYGRIYRASAVADPHLYSVMFGSSSLAGFSLSDDDRQHGRYTMAGVVACTERCMRAGRFDDGDPFLVAHHMWTTVHGVTSLELGSYLVEPYGADDCFESLLPALMVGAGDVRERAVDSVELSRSRFQRPAPGPLSSPSTKNRGSLSAPATAVSTLPTTME
ncbi:TetR/AcrR family transcriptional regulator [Nocardiopsis sp. N85]|uniref:TetR/AcrR family transcriptional regulator n=1 Tax=Nocardiopsis sp. N85 TaxID=3029400 RepID=UPI00237F3CAF|nr:TetR/AcrR family transcriptional regulator [Nocardiopsis sp. N85]MDE3723216.1 TetR/AcrR family transcriptional regulator [Nocardiopsis sp. N85]